MIKPILVASVIGIFATTALGSQIETACVKSKRDAASRAICGCIQDVADLTLSTGDQQLASKFFSDPQMAQDIRQSNRRNHENFWSRYKEFGDAAKAFCS